MKIKLDFVTNSSSACFLVSIPKNDRDEFEEYVSALNEHVDAINEGVDARSYDTMEELNEYTNDGPMDWASIPGGPKFVWLAESQYLLCKEALENNHIVFNISVDYNVCDQFENDWEENIMECIT